jgi:peroxisomal 2,4-dienoyl-CoA reductase
LKATKAGVIINISATLHYGATPWQLHASSAKAAIDALTRNLGASSPRAHTTTPNPMLTPDDASP